ncbi:hypothetical protein [Ruminococcus sp. FC2018]|uniref:hypothetical protein n=1 Tax=Ruminococcus sp. FC2018 TaxID=1410617 RepID=UPI00055CC4CD|nr:hypothetical protein [Ruminococcus sp. FC2018]
MDEKFILCQGVSLRSTGQVVSAFTVQGEDVKGILSAPLILPAARAFIKSVKEPVFFFLELPAEDGESYETYYLDNCTKPVAEAIIKRFGELVANDGISRFGFGSNSTEEEIYFKDYQEFSAYLRSPQGFAAALEKLGVQEKDSFATLWQQLSDDNVGSLSPVELDGETVYDIPGALEQAGMYLSQEE